MACSLPHTDSEVEAMFEDSCAVMDDLRKTYKKCNDISQESRALICTLLRESSEKDRKLHLSMYGKAEQLEKQMDAKSAWFQEKYFGRTHGGHGTKGRKRRKLAKQARMMREILFEFVVIGRYDSALASHRLK
ncbi:hypothetical protein Tco_0309659 [Tanacetum coccineum]